MMMAGYKVLCCLIVALSCITAHALDTDCLAINNAVCLKGEFYYPQIITDCSCTDDDINSGSGSGSGNMSIETDSTCLSCDASCETCYGPNSSQCYTCTSAYIVLEVGVASEGLACMDGLIRNLSLERRQCVTECPRNFINDSNRCVCPGDGRHYVSDNGTVCVQCEEGTSVVNGECVPFGDPKLSLTFSGIVGTLVGVSVAVLLVAVCITLCVCGCGYRAHKERKFWAMIRKTEEDEDAIEGGAKISNTFRKVRNSITRQNKYDVTTPSAPAQQTALSLPRKHPITDSESHQAVAYKESAFNGPSHRRSRGSSPPLSPVIINTQALESEGKKNEVARQSTHIPANSGEALHEAGTAKNVGVAKNLSSPRDAMIHSADFPPRPKPTSPSHGKSFSYANQGKAEPPDETQEEYVEFTPGPLNINNAVQEAYINPSELGITTPQQYETFQSLAAENHSDQEEDQEMYVDLVPGPEVMPRAVRSPPQPQENTTLDNQYITMRDRRSPVPGYTNSGPPQEQNLYQNVSTGQEMYANVR